MKHRQQLLLAEIQKTGGLWPTGRAWDWYRKQGLAPGRGTARKDLEALAARGLLRTVNEEGKLAYLA